MATIAGLTVLVIQEPAYLSCRASFPTISRWFDITWAMMQYTRPTSWLAIPVYLLGGAFTAPGQTPGIGDSRAPDIKFTRVERETGPSHNSIYAVTQDRQGFLWLGTLDGLNRFDGRTFTIYRHDPSDITSLTNNKVNALLEDRAGRFWIGTEGGLDRFDRAEGRFEHYRFDVAGSAVPAINVLFEEKNGTVWAGTDRGLFRHDAVRDRFERVELSTGGDTISGIEGDDEGRLWVSSFRGDQCCGLFMRAPETPAFRSILLPEAVVGPPYSSNQATLFMDRRGALWLGTARLGQFDVETQRFPQGDPPRGAGHVWGMHEDRDGTIWFANSAGVGRFDPKTDVYTSHTIDPDSPDLLQEEVTSLYEDQSGILWAGTYAGLYRYDRRAKAFTHWGHDRADPSRLGGSIVMAVHEDARRVVWVGTYGGGLTSLDRTIDRVTRYRYDPAGRGGLCSDRVLAIHESSDGRLWLGTLEGLCSFDPTTGRFDQHDVPAQVWFIAGEGDDALWLATRTGVYRFEPETSALRAVPHARRSENPTDNIVESLYLEGDSVLWIGTSLQVLYRLSLEDGRSTAHPLVTSDGRVLQGEGLWTIHPGSDGALWLGTTTGLSRFDPETETFRHYFARDGLPSSVVYSILEDESGHLWLGTSQGLARFDLVTETFRTYDERDGIGSTEFNRHAAFKSVSGEFFFGGMNGLTAFFPHQINDSEYVPPVALTRIQASSREGAIDINPFGRDLLVLSYRDYFFSFEFAALDFTNAARNRYAYRLDGFDEGWVEAGARRFAGYTNIPPGDYVFRVRGSNSDGVWNEQGASLRVTITPPFWHRAWFRLLGLIVALGLLAVAYRARVRQLLQRERISQLAEEKSRSEEEARHLAELDAAKTRFFTNVSHEFRTPLTLILGPLEALAGDAQDGQRAAIRTIRSNARRLLRLIDQILDLSKLEAGRLSLDIRLGDLAAHLDNLIRGYVPLAEKRDVNLSFRTDHEALSVAYDHEKVATIVGNLVSNAIKFTAEGGAVLVTLSSFEEHNGDTVSLVAEIVVKDTGSGIPKEALPNIFNRFEQVVGSGEQQGTGIGLALAKELAELHGGAIVVESEVGLGSVFVVRIPFSGDSGTAEIPKLLEEAVQVGDGEDRPATNGQTPIPDPSKTSGRPGILIVEDNSEVRSLLRGLLEADYEVLEAADGEEGLAMAEARKPDLVLSDVMMPRMDGIALCRAIKSDETLRTVPVVLLTAKASDEAAVEGLEAGADDYVTKPFHAGVLRVKLENLLAARRQMRERFRNEVVVKPTEIVVDSEEEVFLRQVLAVVEEQMHEPRFSVVRLADHVGLSRRQLERRLNDVARQTPAQLIRQMRLERAAQLLRDRYGSVAEVAYAVGFASASYFSTAFRDAFGHSPSDHAERAS